MVSCDVTDVPLLPHSLPLQVKPAICCIFFSTAGLIHLSPWAKKALMEFPGYKVLERGRIFVKVCQNQFPKAKFMSAFGRDSIDKRKQAKEASMSSDV